MGEERSKFPEDEPGVCAMCNRTFQRGEPRHFWSGHEFCTEGCMDEWIQLVVV